MDLLHHRLTGGRADGVKLHRVLVTSERIWCDVARWRYTLDLADYHDDSPGDGTVRLLVEEIERFSPATYSEEPVAAAMDAAWRTKFQ